jgi:uncharacterized protein YndB with AHSA1/START domain
MTDELRFERVINAEREIVFDLFTAPDGQIAFYRGGEPNWLIRSECDLRVGGVWKVEFGPSEEEMYQHLHVFKVIDRPRRLLFTTTETRLDGWSFDFETEILFDERGAQTMMTLIQRGFPTEELRREHTIGLPGAFAQLEDLIVEVLQSRG